MSACRGLKNAHSYDSLTYVFHYSVMFYLVIHLLSDGVFVIFDCFRDEKILLSFELTNKIGCFLQKTFVIVCNNIFFYYFCSIIAKNIGNENNRSDISTGRAYHQ